MSRGIDIGRRLTLDEVNLLRARNIDTLFRYIGPDAQFGYAKGLDGAEVAGILSRGMGIVPIMQKTANVPGYFTAAQGAQDGADARAWLLQVGAPLGIPCIFPVDTDMGDPGTQANVYFNAVFNGLDGAYDLGVYGEFDLIEAVAKFYGGVTYTWQTLAWSGGKISALADAYQFGPTTIGSVVGDLNVVRTDPQWRLVRGVA